MDIDLTLLVQLALLAVLVAVMRPLVFAPLLAVIDSRAQRIQGTRAEAERLRRLGEADRAAYEARIVEARRAAVHEREALREQGRLQAQRLGEAARQRAAAQLLAARRQVEVEAAAASASLGAEVEPLAHQVVKRVLQGRA